MDKQGYKDHLAHLQILFSQQEWKDWVTEMEITYKNADDVLHTLTCENRDIYIGKCLAIKELMTIEDKVKKEIK